MMVTTLIVTEPCNEQMWFGIQESQISVAVVTQIRNYQLSSQLNL